jgi:metallo-beta-lactamase family protein
MKLTFKGACQEVTGSCYLLNIANKSIIVDCGVWQGAKFTEDRNYQPFTFDPGKIDYLILTHAHLDHCGRIPRLYKEGFRGKIITTKATADFANIMLEDSAKVIAEESREGNYPPLYSIEDAANCQSLFEGHNYNEKIHLDGGIEINLQDAGHILGSAIVEIWGEGKKIVFSGDLGNPPVPILKPTAFIDSADYLVMESTYGDQVHEDTKTRSLIVGSAIYETSTMKGALMIPAFALERTQELLYELNKMVENKDIPPMPVYVDSPLAIKALEVFKRHENLYNTETANLIKKGDDIFNFPGLVLTEGIADSKKINGAFPPKVIIAGSGMCQGGRIKYHLKKYLPAFNNQLLIIGYQVEGSLGRKLLERAKSVNIDGDQVKVEAKVRAIGAYSAHADQPKLLNWVSAFKQKPKNIFITHGEKIRAEGLAKAITEKFAIKATVPKQEEFVDL